MRHNATDPWALQNPLTFAPGPRIHFKCRLGKQMTSTVDHFKSVIGTGDVVAHVGRWQVDMDIASRVLSRSTFRTGASIISSAIGNTQCEPGPSRTV